VEGRGHLVPDERLLVAAAAEEREDLERLALDGVAHRRVVEHRDLLRRAEAGERGLELERLVERLLDERLDHGLAPRAERAAPEAAAEALHAGEADAVHHVRVAVEHRHADVAQGVGHHLGRAALVVVVAEHRDGREAQRAELLHQHARLLGGAVVGEVAAEEEHVGAFGHLGEDRGERAVRRLADVHVAHGGDADGGHEGCLAWAVRRPPAVAPAGRRSGARPRPRTAGAGRRAGPAVSTTVPP
jgi:hypothetical protein